MCYVCDYHCCTSSSGDHCGCEQCPQPLCHSHTRYNAEVAQVTDGGMISQAIETSMRQGYREEMIANRVAVQTARENVILTTGRAYPEPGAMYDPHPEIAATRPDEQPGHRVAGSNYDTMYVPPPMDVVPPPIAVVVGRPDVGTTEPELATDGWGNSLGVAPGSEPLVTDEGVKLPPDDDTPPEIDEHSGNFVWGNTYDGTAEAGPWYGHATAAGIDPGGPRHGQLVPAESPVLYPDTTESYPGVHDSEEWPIADVPPPRPDHPLLNQPLTGVPGVREEETTHLPPGFRGTSTAQEPPNPS